MGTSFSIAAAYNSAVLLTKAEPAVRFWENRVQDRLVVRLDWTPVTPQRADLVDHERFAP